MLSPSLLIGMLRSMRIPYKIDSTYGELLPILVPDDHTHLSKASSRICLSSTSVAVA